MYIHDLKKFNIIRKILHPNYIGTLDEKITDKEELLKSIYFENLNKSESLTLTTNPMVIKINSYGFRSQPFHNIKSDSTNILFSGCSWTEGNGLPDEYVWRSILTEKFKKQFPEKDIQQYNTGVGGGSISLSCKNVLAFLRKHDNIDYVYMLLPGFDRSTGFEEKNNSFAMIKLFTAPPESLLFKNKAIKKYTKNYNEIESIYHNLILIQAVIDICQLRGIKLFFGTWYSSMKYVYEYMNLDGYCDIPQWNQTTNKDTTLNLVANDGIHPGLEHMTEIANAFYEKTFNG
jgi:hypothetical protein